MRRPGSEPAGTRARAGDLGDSRRLEEALVGERPDCVIHLAAEIASRRSERKVREVNVAGTERLLRACTALAGGDRRRAPLRVRVDRRDGRCPWPGLDRG